MNREIRKLEEDLVNTINSSDVCIEAKKHVLLTVLHAVEEQANLAIIAEQQKAMEEGENKNAESTRLDEE